MKEGEKDIPGRDTDSVIAQKLSEYNERSWWQASLGAIYWLLRGMLNIELGKY